MNWWPKRRASVAALASLVAVAATASGVARPTLVERIRYVGTASYSRVMIDLSAPARYSVLEVPGDGTSAPPKRLVVDIPGAKIGPEAKEPLTIGDALLQRIRTGQFTVETARVVLDFAHEADARVFTLPDPFRLVIDLRGLGSDAPKEGAEVRRLDSVRAPKAPDAAPATTSTSDVAKPRQDAESAPSASPRSAGRPKPGVAPEKDEAKPQKGETIASLPKTVGERRFKVMLDPGHGGKDPGARGVRGIEEKEVVLGIARELALRLREEPGIDVSLTREDDRTLSLEERTAIANAFEADLFVSIHGNASLNRSVRGVEVYYLNNTNNRGTLRLAAMENGLRWDPSDRSLQSTIPDLSYILSDLRQTYKVEESRALAASLGRSVVNHLQTRWPDIGEPGVKEGPFYVLVGAYMPCVLVEVSYLTNPVEGVRLGSRTYRKAIADGIFQGIRDYIQQTRVAKTL